MAWGDGRRDNFVIGCVASNTPFAEFTLSRDLNRRHAATTPLKFCLAFTRNAARAGECSKVWAYAL